MRSLPAPLRGPRQQKALAIALWLAPPLLQVGAVSPAGPGPPQDTPASPKTEKGLGPTADPTPCLRFLSAIRAPRENCHVRSRNDPAIPFPGHQCLPRLPLPPARGSRRHGRALSSPPPRLQPVFPERTRESFPASRSVIPLPPGRPAERGCCPPLMPYLREDPSQGHFSCCIRLQQLPGCIRPRKPQVF